MKTPIVIIGYKGMLGQDLMRLFQQTYKEGEVIGLDREQIDITDRESIAKALDAIAPAVVINSAAYNAVDACEEKEGETIAMQVNGEGPGNLAQYCKNNGISFVHYSTDYVFDGNAEAPYTEEMTPNPQSVYAQSKYLGEKKVMKVGGTYFIIRTCRLFGQAGESEQSKESFVDVMLKLSQNRSQLDVVDEEIASPTYTADLAVQTERLLEGDYEAGIYHVTNTGSCTWYEFAKEIFRIAGKEIALRPVGADAFPRPAARPAYSVLANTKLEEMRSWQEALAAYMKSR